MCTPPTYWISMGPFEDISMNLSVSRISVTYLFWHLDLVLVFISSFCCPSMFECFYLVLNFCFSDMPTIYVTIKLYLSPSLESQWIVYRSFWFPWSCRSNLSSITTFINWLTRWLSFPVFSSQLFISWFLSYLDPLNCRSQVRRLTFDYVYWHVLV